MEIGNLMNVVEGVFEHKDAMRPCRHVRDIQLRDEQMLHLQSTIAEATVYLRSLGIASLPVTSSSSTDKKTLSSIHVIDAKSILDQLLAYFTDHSLTLDQFFKISLSELPNSLGCIVNPNLNIIDAVSRMYEERSDLLLVCDHLQLSGLVTSSEVLDEIISMGVFGETVINADTPSSSEKFHRGTTKPCYFNQKIGMVAEKPPVIQLNADNTFLTAIRILLNKQYDYLFLSNHQYEFYKFVTPELLLHALLSYCDKYRDDTTSMDLRSVMMMRLDAFFDFSSVRLTCRATVQESVETLCFNDLRCAPVYSDDEQLCGVLTRRCILKAFLDAMNSDISRAG